MPSCPFVLTYDKAPGLDVLVRKELLKRGAKNVVQPKGYTRLYFDLEVDVCGSEKATEEMSQALDALRSLRQAEHVSAVVWRGPTAALCEGDESTSGLRARGRGEQLLVDGGDV